MAIYAKRISPDSRAFSGRVSTIYSGDQTGWTEVSKSPIPDSVVLCNGCNRNIHGTDIPLYMVYLDKRSLDHDQPYDCFCEPCLKRYFKGAKVQ